MANYIAHERFGYFGKDVPVHVDAHLPGHAYAQAGIVERPNGDIWLYSYSTHVCTLSGDWLYCYGLYSATTRKHIGWFMRSYAHSNYYLAKKAYETGKGVNVRTGQLRDM